MPWNLVRGCTESTQRCPGFPRVRGVGGETCPQRLAALLPDLSAGIAEFGQERSSLQSAGAARVPRRASVRAREGDRDRSRWYVSVLS